jgi:hypothetical protein
MKMVGRVCTMQKARTRRNERNEKWRNEEINKGGWEKQRGTYKVKKRT